MQSANGALDMLLSLTRNMPFKIGPVTFYMQAHVINSTAYDVLLGCPFDVLTEHHPELQEQGPDYNYS